MLSRNAIKKAAFSTLLIFSCLEAGINIFNPQNSITNATDDQTDNHLEIGTCQNQHNQVSIEIISIQKIENNPEKRNYWKYNYNAEFNLRINNHSSQPIRFALHKFNPELIGEQGRNLPFTKKLDPFFPFLDTFKYFYPEIQPFGSVTFAVPTMLYRYRGKIHLVLFNYAVHNDFELLENKEVLTARFKYLQNESEEPYLDDGTYKIMREICTGEFWTNSVKFDLSAY
jgi:hypothetical protein